MKRRFSDTLLLLLLFLAGNVSAQYGDHRNRKTDSLERVLESENPPRGEQLMRAYLDLMWGYLQTDGKRSAEYAHKAVDLSYKMNALNARVDALRILGLISYGGDDYETALDYFDQALNVTEQMKGDKRYEESDIDNNLSALYGSIANVYNMQDKAHLAIHYYQLAAPIFEKHHWMESTAILYYNIGELYSSMGNGEEAERTYLLAVAAAEASGDSLLMAMPHKGLAKLYLGSDLTKAEESAQICYDYYSRHVEEEREDYIVTLLVLARIQKKHYHDLDRAEALVNEATELINNDVGSETVGDLYNACCELAMERQQWQKAEEFAWKAIDAGESDTYNDLGSYVYLTQIYAELGDIQKVKECVTTVFNGMEQFATTNYQSSLSQMEVLYETEKKQAAIEQLKREKHWYAMGSVLVGCILLLLALLFFLLWRAVRQSKKTAVVKAKLDGELSERVRLAHDLHDRMGGLLTAIKQNIGDADGTAAELTDEAMREMRNVAHHLLPDALQRYGLRTALRDYCMTMKKVGFSFIGDEKHIEIVEIAYCIVHELVNNAVKSADADHVQVQMIVDQENTTINVSDDGNGLIDLDAHGCTGLRGIRERVETIGGLMDVYAKPDEGCEINIVFKNDRKDD